MDYPLHNVVGNLGVLLIVGTYFLVQIRRMSALQPPYIVLNGLGALFILYSLWFDFNLSAFLIELIWLLISRADLAADQPGRAWALVAGEAPPAGPALHRLLAPQPAALGGRLLPNTRTMPPITSIDDTMPCSIRSSKLESKS
jgi:hypothetical protein